jgi:general secretion pathway protein D
MRGLRRLLALALLAALAVAGTGCSASIAYRKGKADAKDGDWDSAVARFTRAALAKPDKVEYKLALENARTNASRQHYEKARQHLAAAEIEAAASELDIAVKYDSSNQVASDELAAVRARLASAEREKERLSDYESMRARANAEAAPVAVLSPRSPVPIFLNFPDQSLQRVFETMGKLAGVNVLFDEAYRDKRTSVNLSGVSFQEALDQLTFSNRLFYRVLDQNTLILVPDTPAKRRQYDEILLRTFYLRYSETKDLEQILKTQLGSGPKVSSNANLGAITLTGTVDQLALAARIVELNDKPRGEVVVEVQIMEVNRERARRFGLDLSSKEVGVTLAPFSAPDGASDIDIRAHLLSSLNLSDFVVTLPSNVFARFLQTDSTRRILATPRLRAAEGKKTTLKIGQEVPVPVTTFQSTNTGGGTFSPATSFQYRNVGITMDVTPRVTPGGEIVLELAAEFSLEGVPKPLGGDLLPTFNTRSVNGILRLRDGETSLIGGLLQQAEVRSMSSVLGVNNIPILNKVLGSNDHRDDESEIIISVTPRLVRLPRVEETDLRSVAIGTGEAIRLAGARPPLFGSDPMVTPTPPMPPSGGGAAPAPPTPSPSPSPAVVPRPQPTPVGVPPGGPLPQPIAPPQAVPEAMRPPGIPGTRSIDPPIPGAEQPTDPAAAPPAAPVAPPVSVSAGGASFTPNAVAIPTGQTGSVGLIALDVTFSRLDLVLVYDPTLLEVVDVQPGPLLTLDGTSIGTDKTIESGSARVRFSRPSPVTGSGVVATVLVRALRAGNATLAAAQVTLGGTAGDQGLTVGAVSVTVTP